MAAPADGLTVQSDLVIQTDIVAARMSPALKEAVVGMTIIATQEFPSTTNVIKWPKSGSLIAEAVNEGVVYAPSDANSDINDSAVTTTGAKVMVSSNITDEAYRFGGGTGNFPRVAAEQGRALGRKFDDDLLALFDAITATATASSTMDATTLLTAKYNIDSALCPPGRRVALLGFKQVLDLGIQAATSGAAQYAVEKQLAILNGSPAVNGLVASYLGVDIFQTTGHSTTGGDVQGAMWDPSYGFCAGVSGVLAADVAFTGPGVPSAIPGVSYNITGWMYYDIEIWNQGCCSEVRSDAA